MLTRELVFHGYHATGWFFVWLGTILAAGALMLMLLRYERRLVSRRVGNSLLVLRLLVLTTLFLTLLQPALTWTIDRTRMSRILLAVDLSESMDTGDNHATEDEKFRWARALGMIGNDRDAARMDEWERAFAEKREPEWVDESESADPERRRQLAEVRRGNVDGIFAELDRLSRKQIALRLLTETPTPLLRQLQEVGNVEVVVFAGEAEAVDPETIEQYFTERPETLLAGVSNMAQPLSSGAGADEGPLAGVVLLTDGRDTSTDDPANAARRLGQLGAPVFPLILGSEFTPKDLAVGLIDYPQTVFKDDNVLMAATISTSGFAGRDVTVVLEREGEEPQKKTMTPDGPSMTVDFQLDAAEVGRREYTLRVEEWSDETRDDNNEQTFAMNVVDDTVRVLIIEGEPRWEFRYLHNALDRDERVDVHSIVFDQPYLGILNDTFFPRRLALPNDVTDLQASPFAEPDLVILGDVGPANLPHEAWQLIERYVADAGGTLVFVAGRNHMPLSYQSPLVAQLLPMTDLQPVNLSDVTEIGPPQTRGLHLKLTGDGEREMIMQFDVDRLANRDVWAGLPGHSWAMFGSAKPAATVFAYGIRPGRNADLENERENAIVVHQHYGFGQTLWIGVDSTWRWRFRVGDEYHHRFWGQLGRWAAENKATAGNEFVRFGLGSNDIEVGQDAVIRAQWTQRFLRQFPDLRANAILHRVDDDDADDGEPFSVLELIPVEGRPLDFETRAVGLPAGQYRVTLDAENADLGEDVLETMLFVHEVRTVELSDLSANRDLLMNLADLSGGRLFEPHEKDEIAAMFRTEERTEAERHETELWDHWSVMLVFFVLLTAEWVVRKLNGLP